MLDLSMIYRYFPVILGQLQIGSIRGKVGSKSGAIGMAKLTVAAVRGFIKPGRYADGQGLFLDIRGGSRAWVYRFQLDKRERLMSLGSAGTITLAEARQRHAAARSLVLRGINPLTDRQAVQAASRAEREAHSFAQAAAAYIESHRAGWRGRTEEFWTRSLAAHAFPAFGLKPVHAIDREDTLRCLERIWRTKPSTAAILRNRLELVLDYAIARGWREKANPARWKGGLKALLPGQAKFHSTTHRPALAWAAAPAFMATLMAEDGMATRCLAFCILTAARSGEACGALWSEINLENAVWTIPGSRMKGKKAHTVPLSEAALDLLREAAVLRTNDLVFFSARGGAPLAGSTLRELLQRLHPGISVHGFRSTFSTWAADHRQDATLVETSLAHTVGNAVARAYQRSDLLEARRVLMQQWADFLTREPAQVVPLRAMEAER
jgi:integrase